MRWGELGMKSREISIGIAIKTRLQLCIGMMHETTVELKARYKMLPNDEEGTACRDEDDGGDNEWDCHLRCRLDFIRSICNCTGPTLSHLAKSEEELGKWPLCDYAKCKVE
jgi:hypothetical protein